MARQGKKSKKRLEARINAYNEIKSTDIAGEKCSAHGGFRMTKPGSNKK